MGLRDGLDALGDDHKTSEIILAGGASISDLWGSVLASALDSTMVVLEGSEVGSAMGAARLAWLAVEPDNVDSVCSRPKAVRRWRPDSKRRDVFVRRQGAFRAVYQALKPLQEN